jgi:hypothetical protein
VSFPTKWIYVYVDSLLLYCELCYMNYQLLGAV